MGISIHLGDHFGKRVWFSQEIAGGDKWVKTLKLFQGIKVLKRRLRGGKLKGYKRPPRGFSPQVRGIFATEVGGPRV